MYAIISVAFQIPIKVADSLSHPLKNDLPPECATFIEELCRHFGVVSEVCSRRKASERIFFFLKKRGGPRLRFTFASHRRVLFLGRSGNVRLRHARGHQTPPLRLTLHLTVRLLRDTGQWVPSVETSPTNESSRRRRISNSAAVPRCSDVSALARRWDDKMRSCGAEKGAVDAQ